MYVRYTSHDDANLSHIDDALCRFHTFETVFLLRQRRNMVKAKVNALETQLVNKRKVD
jgi:hypothetical protein